MLVGCVGGDSERYPSLAIRDAERMVGQFTPTTPAAPPVEPVASPAQLGDIVASAQGFHRQFEAARPQVSRLASQARGAGPESEARSRALVAIADLASLHGRTALALGDLDRLEAEAANTFAPVAAIRAAQAQVSDLVTAQDEALAEIESAAR